jgi:CRP-like cAMP-binding protein
MTAMTAEDRSAALRASATFQGVPTDALRLLAETMEEESFGPGEVVCEEGDEALGAYVIAHGSVEVSVSGKVVRRLGPGEIVGEYGMFEGGVRHARVVACEPASLLFVEYPRFREVLRWHPDAMFALWRTTVLRLIHEQRGR